MFGFILLISVLMGTMLFAGSFWFSDAVVMWLASPDESMVWLRGSIVIGLFLMTVIRVYFDNIVLRLVWLTAAVMLLRSGVEYFLNHGDYASDALLMVSSGIAFAIATLQRAPEPLVGRPRFEGIVSAAILAYYARLSLVKRLAVRHYINYNVAQSCSNSSRCMAAPPASSTTTP